MRGLTRAIVNGAAILSAVLVHGCAARTAAVPPASGEGVPHSSFRTPSPPMANSVTSGSEAGDHERLGDAHLGRAEVEQAYFEYREALRLEPGRTAVRYKIGRLLLRRGLLGEAEEEFRTVLKAQLNSALALLGLGHVAFLAGKTDAERLLRDALVKDARLWQAHNLLGLLYERQGYSTRAVTEFYAALRINSGEGSVTNNLGVALLRAGDLKGAALAFERAREIGFDSPRLHNNLGLALARLGRSDEALAAFRRAGSDAAAWNNLGFALLMEGKSSEAAAAFEKAIAADPAYNTRARENLRRARAGQRVGGPGTEASLPGSR